MNVAPDFLISLSTALEKDNINSADGGTEDGFDFRQNKLGALQEHRYQPVSIKCKRIR